MSKYVVGVMSGTSLDGIDVALVKIDGYGQNSKVRLIKYIKEDMPKDVKKEIMNCCDINKSNVRDICSLNFKLGYIFCRCYKKIMQGN